MLLTAHVGYTAGAVWLVQQRLSNKRPVDYRLVALMAILPDIVDRLLFIFLLPGAENGRLIAHTLLFNLVLLAILVSLRRNLSLYGVASLGHLALDAQGLPIHHALWPLLGPELSYIGLTGHGPHGTAPLLDRVWLRAQEALVPYGEISRQALMWELGGLAVLLAFVAAHGLYRPVTLIHFLRTGRIGAGARPSPNELVRRKGMADRN